MKLFVTIASLAVVLADETDKYNSEVKRCLDANSVHARMSGRSATNKRPKLTTKFKDAYMDHAAKGIAAYLQVKEENQHCDAEMCKVFDTLNLDTVEGVEQWMAENGGEMCGAAADVLINKQLACLMCDVDDAQNSQEIDCEPDNDGISTCISRGLEDEKGISNVAAVLQNTATEIEYATDSNTDSGDADGPVGKSNNVSKFFKRVTGKVWNIVVSGGSEYCKDMLPKYPRVICGKMKPGHPNYEMVVEIRDACVALKNIVKGCRCFCIYIMWGGPTWPRKSTGGWKNRFGKHENKVCHYFGNLKGTGCYRPASKPINANCNKGAPGTTSKKPQLSKEDKMRWCKSNQRLCSSIMNKSLQGQCIKKMKNSKEAKCKKQFYKIIPGMAH